MAKVVSLAFSLIFLLSETAAAQNRYTSNYQGYGNWVFQHEDDSGIATHCGRYEIRRISQYDTVSKRNPWDLEVRVGRSTERISLYPFEPAGDSISVKDGIWTFYAPNGTLTREDSFSNGVLYWAKDFDDHGRLCKLYQKDFEQDKSDFIVYQSGRMFRRSYYDRGDPQHEVIDYYPENSLSITDAEPVLWAVIDKAPAIKNITLRARKSLTLESVSSAIPGLTIGMESGLPVIMQAGDSVKLLLSYNPKPVEIADSGSIHITTKENGEIGYTLFCSLNATHLEWLYGDTLEHVRLSKARDKYFVTSPNRHAKIVIDRPGMKSRYFFSKAARKIALNEFDCGVYNFQVWQDDAFLNVVLELVE